MPIKNQLIVEIERLQEEKRKISEFLGGPNRSEAQLRAFTNQYQDLDNQEVTAKRKLKGA